MSELDILLDTQTTQRTAGRRHVMGGEFNANSPIKRIDPAHCKPRTQRDWEANSGHLPRRAVQKILDEGYLDTLHVADGDRAADIGTFDTQHPGQRVDYIFAFGFDPKAIRAAWAEHDKL